MNRVRALIVSTGAAVALSSAAMGQIVQWNFNSTPGDANSGTGTLTPNVGLGTASLVGGTTATFASGDAGTGSTDPETGTPTNDSGWNVSTFAAQGTGSGTRGVQFAVSTVGFSNIVVSWDHRHSNTSPSHWQFQYSTDGTTFTDFGAVFVGNAGDTWFNNRSVDLSSITAVNENPNFAFRIVAVFAPGGAGYVASSPTGTYGTSGTARFDMVTVVPAPGAAAVGLAGLLAIGRRRR